MEKESTSEETWKLAKCDFEFSTNQKDYVCRLKIEGPETLSKKYSLGFLLKHLFFPLSEKFIFVFDLSTFITTCERIDNFFTGSRNPIQTLNEGANTFFSEMLKRPDILSSMTFLEFFKLKEERSKSSLLPLKELMNLQVQAWDDEMLVHTLKYDPVHRVLILNCKLNGIFANFGRIWSVIEKVNLSALEVYHIKRGKMGRSIEVNHKLTYMSQEIVNDVTLVHEILINEDTQASGFEDDKFEDPLEDKENVSDPLNESVMTISNWHQE